MSEREDVQQLRDLLKRERSEIVRLTYRMKPEVAGPYFEKVDAAQAALDALEEVAEAAGRVVGESAYSESGRIGSLPPSVASLEVLGAKLARLREGEA